METNFSPKFVCETCNIKTSNKKDYNKHILTAKHKMLTNVNELGTNCSKIPEKNKDYTCEKCNKIYLSRVGLWKHKKKCNNLIESENNEYMYQGINIKDKDALVLHLLKQNGDLQNKIIEMASQPNTMNNSNNINTTNNIGNKTFNLQFFLNETCKDAMNITDFVNNVKVELDDLENTGRCGYIEGITDIIFKNLNKLEQPLRPLHCSDLKREILYIKDNNEWTKETEEKPILTKAIKTIANENIKQIYKWREKYPDCTQADSKKNDLYLKIVSNSMNGLTKEEGDKNINKIISNVAKKVIIDK
jgi:hypothetical protein